MIEAAIDLRRAKIQVILFCSLLGVPHRDVQTPLLIEKVCAIAEMTRGSQRDRDRERAQARSTAKGKGKDDGLTAEQRRERDAKALQEKLAKKNAQGGAPAAAPPNPKATKK